MGATGPLLLGHRFDDRVATTARQRRSAIVDGRVEQGHDIPIVYARGGVEPDEATLVATALQQTARVRQLLSMDEYKFTPRAKTASETNASEVRSFGERPIASAL